MPHANTSTDGQGEEHLPCVYQCRGENELRTVWIAAEILHSSAIHVSNVKNDFPHIIYKDIYIYTHKNVENEIEVGVDVLEMGEGMAVMGFCLFPPWIEELRFLWRELRSEVEGARRLQVLILWWSLLFQV